MMNLEALKEAIKGVILGVQIGLRYKAIFREKQLQYNSKEKPMSVIHVELNLNQFQKNFNLLISKFSKIISDFKDRRKMRF